jgi:hypothetical protein
MDCILCSYRSLFFCPFLFWSWVNYSLWGCSIYKALVGSSPPHHIKQKKRAIRPEEKVQETTWLKWSAFSCIFQLMVLWSDNSPCHWLSQIVILPQFSPLNNEVVRNKVKLQKMKWWFGADLHLAKEKDRIFCNEPFATYKHTPACNKQMTTWVPCT